MSSIPGIGGQPEEENYSGSHSSSEHDLDFGDEKGPDACQGGSLSQGDQGAIESSINPSQRRERRPPQRFDEEDHRPTRQKKRQRSGGAKAGGGVKGTSDQPASPNAIPEITILQAPNLIDPQASKRPQEKDVDKFMNLLRRSLGRGLFDGLQSPPPSTVAADDDAVETGGQPASQVPGLKSQERQNQTRKLAGSLAGKTLQGYCYEITRFLWFVEDLESSPAGFRWADSKNMAFSDLSSDLTTISGRATVVRFLWWISAKMPGWYERPGAPKASARKNPPNAASVESAMAGLSLLYDAQRSELGIPASSTLRAHKEIEDAVNIEKRSLGIRRVDINSKEDPQLHTAGDLFTVDEFEKMCKNMMLSSDKNAPRLYALSTFMFSSAARGDDARQLLISNICKPIKVGPVGPVECFIIPLLILAGKTQQAKGKDYKGLVRSKNPLLCAMGALARYFHSRFTLDKEPFPDPNIPSEWKTTLIFAGSTPRTQLSYSTHNKGVSGELGKLKIAISSTTHSFRSAGAQALEQAGLGLPEIMRVGQWTTSILEKTYLLFFTPRTVLAAGGFDGVAENNYNTYWDDRFYIEMPESVLERIFPFVKDLEAKLEKAEAQNNDAPRPSVKGVYQTMRMLGTVLWQDAVQMVESRVCFDEQGQCQNPSINALMQFPEFQKSVAIYATLKSLQFYENGRPRSHQEELSCMRQEMQRLQHAVSAIPSQLLASLRQAAETQGLDFEEAQHAANVVKAQVAAQIQSMANVEQFQHEEEAQTDMGFELILASMAGEDPALKLAQKLDIDHDQALEGFISPSKLLPSNPAARSHGNVALANTSVQKDLSSAFSTMVSDPHKNSATSVALPSQATLDTIAMNPAASALNNFQEKTVTLTESQLKQLLASVGAEGGPSSSRVALPNFAPASYLAHNSTRPSNYIQGVPPQIGNPSFPVPGSPAAAMMMMAPPPPAILPNINVQRQQLGGPYYQGVSPGLVPSLQSTIAYPNILNPSINNIMSSFPPPPLPSSGLAGPGSLLPLGGPQTEGEVGDISKLVAAKVTAAMEGASGGKSTQKRALPLFSAFTSLEQFVNEMMKPTREGLLDSIYDMEIKPAVTGVGTADTKWREGDRNAGKAMPQIKRFFTEIHQIMASDTTRMSELAAARKLDQERQNQGCSVAKYIETLYRGARKKKKGEGKKNAGSADVEDENNEDDGEGPAGGQS